MWLSFQKLNLSRLIKLIEDDIISKGLYINCIKYEAELNALGTAVQNSNSIGEFSVVSSCPESLTLCSNVIITKFQYLKFGGNINLKSAEQAPCCVDELTLTTHPHKVRDLLNVPIAFQNLVYLDCNICIFLKALSINSSVFKSLRELTLHAEVHDLQEDSCSEFLTDQMPSLDALSIICPEGKNYQNLVEHFLVPVLKSNNLKFMGLLLNRMHPEYILSFLTDAFWKLLQSHYISLLVLLMTTCNYPFFPQMKELTSLKQLLMDKQVEQLTLVNLEPDVEYNDLPFLFPVEEFLFSREINGCKQEHSIWSRQRYTYRLIMDEGVVIKMK